MGILADILIRITGDSARLRTEFDKAQRSSKTFSKTVQENANSINRAFSLARVAAAGFAAALAVREITQAGIAMQGLDRAFRAAAGGAEAGKREFAFVKQEAERLGLSLETSAKAYAKLTAAAQGTSLQGAQAREIFVAVAEASRVMSLSTEQTEGALTAIEQIISKGKVSAEELRGQLGERLPGAFQIAARSIGVTTAELDNMLKKGELTAEQLLPALAAELRKTFGGEVESAANDAQAAYARFGNAVLELKASIANSGVLDAMTELARSASGATRDISTFLVRLGLIKNPTELQRFNSEIAESQIALNGLNEQLRTFQSANERSGPAPNPFSDEDIKRLQDEITATENKIESLIRKRRELATGSVALPTVTGGGTTGPTPVPGIDASARLAEIQAAASAELQIAANLRAQLINGQAITDQQIIALAKNRAQAIVNQEIATGKEIKDLQKRLNDEEIRQIEFFNQQRADARKSTADFAPLDELRSRLQEETNLKLSAAQLENAQKLNLERELNAAFFAEKQVSDARLRELAAQNAVALVEIESEAERAARGALGEPLTAEDQFDQKRAELEREIELYKEYAGKRLEVESDMLRNIRAQEQQAVRARSSALGNLVGLLQAFGSKSKAVSVAILAIEKGKAIADTFIWTKAAELRAIAELGPIAGPPVAAKIAAYGKLNMGLIAASGLVQAAGIGGGGGISGSYGSVNSSASTATPDNDERRDRGAVQITFSGDIFGWDEYIQTKVIAGIKEAVDDRDVVVFSSNSRQAQEIIGAV